MNKINLISFAGYLQGACNALKNEMESEELPRDTRLSYASAHIVLHAITNAIDHAMKDTETDVAKKEESQ